MFDFLFFGLYALALAVLLPIFYSLFLGVYMLAKEIIRVVKSENEKARIKEENARKEAVKKNEETRLLMEKARENAITIEKRLKTQNAKEERKISKPEDREKKMIQKLRRIGFWRLSYNGRIADDIEKNMSLLSEIVKYPIIVDTNIWMDSALEGFWYDFYKLCSKNNRTITVPSSVYDEAIRLKNSYDQTKKYNGRVAIDRFAKFSNAKLLNLINIKRVADPKAYADPDIIKMCEDMQNDPNTESFSLITNDMDLIVRTRHILNKQTKKSKKESFNIYSISRTEFSENWNNLRHYLPKNK